MRWLLAYLAPSTPQVAIPMPQIDISTQTGQQMAEAMAFSAAFSNSVQEYTQTLVAQATSPFTAATGDKAKAILREMLSSNRLIYRTVGYNEATSTQGEVIIDVSFKEALRQIGITENMLQ